MIQAADRLRLLVKTSDSLALFTEMRMQQLDSYRLIELHVPGSIDDTHTALTDTFLDLILVFEQRAHAPARILERHPVPVFDQTHLLLLLEEPLFFVQPADRVKSRNG